MRNLEPTTNRSGRYGARPRRTAIGARAVLGALAAILCVAAAHGPRDALATDPTGPVAAQRIKLPGRGSGGQFSATLLVGNSSDGIVDVAVAPASSSGHSVTPTSATMIPPGATAEIVVSGEILAPGKHAVALDLIATGPAGEDFGKEHVLLYMLASRAADGSLSWKRSTYRGLFLKGVKQVPGVGRAFAATAGEPAGLPVETLPAEFVDLDELERGTSREVSGGATGTGGLAGPRAALRTFTGRFRWVGTDGLLHPGYGWRVQTWYQDGNSVKKADERWINLGDGSFTITADVPAGKPVLFLFRTANRYVRPVNKTSGKDYQWATGWLNPAGDPAPVGTWSVNLNDGDARGLGELHRDAISLWNQLYTRTSVSPLRDAPIEIRFPNASGCFDCADPQGIVYISAAKADNHRTIFHELGHQLMYEYWDNQLPPNSGGKHSWSQCYTGGLAMSEGFAHFVSYWVQVSRTAQSPAFPGGWAVESLPNTVCANDSANELRAAATFWDLHDQPGVEDDALSLPDEDTLRLFLEGGLANDMSVLRPTYRAGQSASAQTAIDAIFTMNFTFNPPAP